MSCCPSLATKFAVLAEAQQRAVFLFTPPTDLPPQTTVEKVYITQDGRRVSLFYNNPTLSDAHSTLPFAAQIIIYLTASETDSLSGIIEGLSAPPAPVIAEVQFPNGTRIVQTSSQSAVGSVVEVCGVTGFGRGAEGPQGAALTFWKDGVTYLIIAEVSLDRLTAIANSMC